MTASRPAAQFKPFDCALDTPTLIEASAGTGKTWNISGLYLRLLLEKNLPVEQILVVTFTKAATAELRDRIRTRVVEMLESLGHGGPIPDPFLAGLASLMESLDISRQDMIARLDIALQSFDQSAICTIHSFCQRALAETPFGAGMPFTTEIVQDDSQELGEAVNDFWRRHIGGSAGADSADAADAADSADAANAAGAGYLSPLFARHLVTRKDNPQKFQALLRRHVGKPKAQIQWPDGIDAGSQGGTNIESTHERIVALYGAARQAWTEHGAAIRELLENAGLKASHNPEKLAQAFAECDNYFAQADAAKCKARLRLLSASRLAAATRAGRNAPEHGFFQLMEAVVTELPALLDTLEQSLEIRRLQLIRAMLEEGGKALRGNKRAKRLVSYDDLLVNLYSALHPDAAGAHRGNSDRNSGSEAEHSGDGKHGNPNSLAATLRKRYPVALIDEFQDTDPLQFDIFNTIYAGDNASLFLVGDPKQAIYSFRNADLHTYLQAKHGVRATYTLASNQRSSEGLIAALNTLFGTNPRAFMLPGLDYQPVAFGEKKRLPFHDASSPPGDLQLWMLPHQDDRIFDRSAAFQLATEATASEIARLVSRGAAGDILLDERPLAPGDIAVLVRSHTQAARIREALSQRGVSSIEISQDSVFTSSDAADVDALLCAILDPARQGLVLAALATPLLGYHAAQIDAIAASESALLAHVTRFANYRETWFRQGLGYMYRQFLEREGVSRRMLRRPDGERRMTNLRHIGEALQQAQQQSQTPESVLRWLQSQRQEAAADEAAQLRLESDRDLVQILTIHKSKGLEYPIVFCPYLWDGYQRKQSSQDGREYHGADGKLLIDFRIDKQSVENAKRAMRDESNAETLRLYYVALTRASHRCYVVAGPYSSKNGKGSNTNESGRSMLNWLVNPAVIEMESWHKTPLAPAQTRQAWDDFAQACPHVLLRGIGELALDCVATAQTGGSVLQAREAHALLKDDWRASSFSGLVRGMSDAVVADHDGLAAHEANAALHAAGDAASIASFDAASHPVSGAASDAASARAATAQPASTDDDILLFPRGTQAGECIHAAFELADFADPSSWPAAAEQALQAFPQPTDKVGAARQARMLERMIADVVSTRLATDVGGAGEAGSAGGGFQLSQLDNAKRLTELEFSFTAHGLRAADLNGLLQESGYRMPPLAFNNLDGFLKGFIDMVFQHDGRFYVLDWKSNHLGMQPEDYRPDRLHASMSGHGYTLQYLVYTVALHRYLSLRMPGYSYDKHVGGVLYLFIRGVRPQWQHAPGGAGIHFDRPAWSCIQAFERLLGHTPQQEAA